ncbi:MAG: ACP S-malonyltransferase, partial [Gemmatimonadota bacterium]
MSIAFQFPGQGSQAVGMGASLADAYPEARAVFQLADEVLGFSLSTVCWEGPEDRLRATENAQPALLTHSTAVVRVLAGRGVVPECTAGHSLGEFASHVAAGSLSFEDALRLVRARGEAMAEAGRASPGTMAAVLGLEAEGVEALCRAVRTEGEVLEPANYNAPGQVVISGTRDAVLRAVERARDHGARKAVEIPVSGAFHSPLMAAAAERLSEALAEVE